MNLTPAIIKELREKSGAGMMDCKKALDESDGNVEKAIEWLRKKGINTFKVPRTFPNYFFLSFA